MGGTGGLPVSPATGSFWSGFDWQRKFGIAWSVKYKTMRTTAGQANMRAAQDLHDMLAELEADDRRAAEAAAPAPDPERDYRPPKLVFTPRPRNITPDDGADPPAPALARR
jgi:hypothetical protein